MPSYTRCRWEGWPSKVKGSTDFLFQGKNKSSCGWFSGRMWPFSPHLFWYNGSRLPRSSLLFAPTTCGFTLQSQHPRLRHVKQNCKIDKAKSMQILSDFFLEILWGNQFVYSFWVGPTLGLASATPWMPPAGSLLDACHWTPSVVSIEAVAAKNRSSKVPFFQIQKKKVAMWLCVAMFRPWMMALSSSRT